MRPGRNAHTPTVSSWRRCAVRRSTTATESAKSTGVERLTRLEIPLHDEAFAVNGFDDYFRQNVMAATNARRGAGSQRSPRRSHAALEDMPDGSGAPATHGPAAAG
ncbi:MAG: hypothetical protein OXC83_13150 [Chloroflexi bacterium]|nr:hypothetical protein [Chloroflexota bacterium]